MAVNFAEAFGMNNMRRFGLVNNQAPIDEREKAVYWLNIGYEVEVSTDEGMEKRFISMPTGVPLDTQKKLPTNSRNEQFAAFQAARNDLLDQLLALANTLEPGEDRILNLQVQLRRVNDAAEVTQPENNPFRRKLDLVG